MKAVLKRELEWHTSVEQNIDKKCCQNKGRHYIMKAYINPEDVKIINIGGPKIIAPRCMKQKLK